MNMPIVAESRPVRKLLNGGERERRDESQFCEDVGVGKEADIVLSGLGRFPVLVDEDYQTSEIVSRLMRSRSGYEHESSRLIY